MATVKALERIRHSGRRYVEGDVIEGLTDKQAEQLIASGSVTRDTEGKAPAEGKPVEKKESAVKKRIKDAKKDADKPKKTVAEKARDRAAKKTPSSTVKLPVKFKVGKDQYTAVKDAKGRVNRYELNGEQISKAQYAEAYEEAKK